VAYPGFFSDGSALELPQGGLKGSERGGGGILEAGQLASQESGERSMAPPLRSGAEPWSSESACHRARALVTRGSLDGTLLVFDLRSVGVLTSTTPWYATDHTD